MSFIKLLDHNPNYAAAYFHGAQTLEKLGRIDEAKGLYRRGIEVTSAMRRRSHLQRAAGGARHAGLNTGEAASTLEFQTGSLARERSLNLLAFALPAYTKPSRAASSARRRSAFLRL